MSLLTIYPDNQPNAVALRTEDPGQIATALREIKVRFERWSLPVTVEPGAEPEQILESYRPYLDRLIGEGGAGSADVIKLTPDHPSLPALRAKFLDEHTHTEDEVRFFVSGAANFVIHENGRVYDARCTAGDLISIPANIKHWFETGDRPEFTVLRIFTDQAGWVPHYTGDDISRHFPAAQG